MKLLEVNQVSKRFGGLTANQDVSFTVDTGQVVGLIGPNGAGKTTMFNCVAGFFAPTAGSILLGGHNSAGLPPEACARAGVASERTRAAATASRRSDFINDLFQRGRTLAPPSTASCRETAKSHSKVAEFGRQPLSACFQ